MNGTDICAVLGVFDDEGAPLVMKSLTKLHKQLMKWIMAFYLSIYF